MPAHGRPTQIGRVVDDPWVIIARTLVALPLLALTLTGCGGSTPSTSNAASQPGSSSTPSSGVTSAGPQPTSLATLGSTPSSGPAGRASTAPGSAQQASGQPVSAGQPTAGAPRTANQPAVAGSPTSTPPGVYTYGNTGTFTAFGTAKDASGTSTLTVDPAVGDAQHSVLKGERDQTIQDVSVRSAGSFLNRLQLTNAAFDKTFAPSPAALLLPEPANPGTAWTWKATSTDGSTTVTVKNTVLRTETLTIGGEQVLTTVIRSVLALRGASLTYDGTQDTWFAPAKRLPVKQHNTGNGNSGGVVFSFDTTNTVRSIRPA